MHGAGTGTNTIQAAAGPILTASVQRAGETVQMAKTYRLGPGRRAINVLFTALIQAGLAGRSYSLLTTTGRRTGRRRGRAACRTGRAVRKLAVTRQEALALRKAAGWVRRVLSAG